MYEKHRRNYTVLGASFLLGSIVGKRIVDYYGGQLSEIISVVKDGAFFHFQIVGERQALARCFVEKVIRNEINLEAEYDKFKDGVEQYEKFIVKGPETFDKETIFILFDRYDRLMPVAIASFDAVEALDNTRVDIREKITAWSQKTRIIEESIYKVGEEKFLPRYLQWFKEKLAPDYSTEELAYLVYAELQNFLKNNTPLPSRETLLDRKKLLFIREWPVWNMEFYQGERAEHEIASRKLFEGPPDTLENIKELRGTAAFPGKIQGRVRIVRTNADMKEFQDNEIIVSPMTMPSYLPIMKRALAFVTNEGGTLCHAAIVARELKKPCVIGTKHATHVFKDGEIIEVDAEAGLVRKI